MASPAATGKALAGPGLVPRPVSLPVASLCPPCLLPQGLLLPEQTPSHVCELDFLSPSLDYFLLSCRNSSKTPKSRHLGMA